MSPNMNQIPLFDLKSQYESMKEEIQNTINEVLGSGKYILGPYVEKFEESMARYCGVNYAVAVANGTDALLLTLDAWGIGPGDEVITSAFSFFATSEVISQLGAKPVFVDIEEDTYNLDVNQLEAAITSKTKAIIPVHLFGQPADMDEVMLLAQKHGLLIIEDACQAIGSKYKGKNTGSIGHAGCFSFFPSKNLGCYGDGGMIVTNDGELTQKIKMLRAHGSNPKYHHSMIGYNSRLDALQAAVLQVKLTYLDAWNGLRRNKASIYNDAFKDTPIKRPLIKKDRETNRHLYIIQTPDRDALMKHLQEKGIASGVYYPVPLHRQHVYVDLGYGEGSLPVAEKAALTTMALPLYPELSIDDQQHVIDSVLNFYKLKRQ